MNSESHNEFPAREGPEGNEAGPQGSGEHTHPAGNPIKSCYIFFRSPRWAAVMVAVFSAVATLLNVLNLFLSQMKTMADGMTVISMLALIVMLMVTDIQDEPECQSDEGTTDDDDDDDDFGTPLKLNLGGAL